VFAVTARSTLYTRKAAAGACLVCSPVARFCFLLRRFQPRDAVFVLARVRGNALLQLQCIELRRCGSWLPPIAPCMYVCTYVCMCQVPGQLEYPGGGLSSVVRSVSVIVVVLVVVL